jgi:helicase MOV-10
LCSIEIVEDNPDEDLPEVIVGDHFWLDDRLEGRRYEACVTHVDVFERRRVAVLRMSLRLPTNFEFSRGPIFRLSFRLNRITLRRQYHALATLFTPQRRLLFPSLVDIQPTERRLSRVEIEKLKLKLSNQSIRDDKQQLQTVISILQQPKGTVPFIIFGP